MHSPALAAARWFWWQHRWGLAATVAYFVLAAALFQVERPEDLARSLGNLFYPEALAQGALEVEDLTHVLAGLSAFPIFFALIGLLVACTYGSSTNIAMRESNFPARTFVLPVRTAALVGWPMAYGTAAIALASEAVAGGLLRPCGIAAPLDVPAALAAAFLAWTQAITWSPSRAAWVKPVVAVLVLTTLVMVPIVGLLVFKAPTALLAAGLVATIPLAFAVAVVGVSRARRGDVPEWSWMSRWVEVVGHRLPRRRRPFASADRAQVWFEWRKHGLSLPALVSLLLPLLLLPALNDEIPSAGLLIGAAGFPPVLAMFVGATVGKMNPGVKDYYGVPPFTAVRPLTSGALVGAKLIVAALSTLATWALVIPWLIAVLLLSGRRDVADWVWAGLQAEPLRVVAGALFGLGGLLLLTWERMVENLYVGLTGRAWVSRANTTVWTGLPAILGAFGAWLYYHADYQGAFFAVLPWLLAGAALFKLLAAGLTCRAAWQRGLVPPRTLIRLLSLWLLIAAALVVLLWWLVPGDVVPVGSIVLGVVLFLPLTRLAAAPLALAWNRHR